MSLASMLSYFLLLPVLLSATAPQISLSATHNLAYIGDRIGVTLLIKADGQFEPQGVELNRADQKYELISEGRLDKRQVPEGVVWEQKYEIAFFDLGDFKIGPARISFQNDAGQTETLDSNEVPIKIKGLITDDTAELEPGKPPMKLSGSPVYLLKKIWLPLLLIVSLLVLIILLTRKKKPVLVAASPLSPAQWLDSEWKRLVDERLIEKGFQILFALRLTHLLKVFVKRYYRIDAEEMTTDELLSRLDGHLPSPSAGVALGSILNGLDLVKFAKYEMSLPEYGELGEKTEFITALHRQEELKRQAAVDKGDGPHV